MIEFDDLELKGIKIYNLVRVYAIGDGSCFFHAILLGVSEEYLNLSRRGKIQMAKKLRKRLSQELDEDKYSKLSGGNLESIANGVSGCMDLTLNGLKNTLDSRNFVGQELIELVSNELDIDIYIIDLDKETVYHLGNTEIYHKDRSSIILGYTESGSHYDLIGLYKHKQDEIMTLFSPKHEIIETLRKYLKVK